MSDITITMPICRRKRVGLYLAGNNSYIGTFKSIHEACGAFDLNPANLRRTLLPADHKFYLKSSGHFYLIAIKE